MGALLVGLIGIAGPLVIQVLLALGIGFVTYTGADFAISEAETYVFGNFNNIPVDMYKIAVMAGFDEGIKILFAAAAAQISIKVATGAFTKLRMGGVA